MRRRKRPRRRVGIRKRGEGKICREENDEQEEGRWRKMTKTKRSQRKVEIRGRRGGGEKRGKKTKKRVGEKYGEKKTTKRKRGGGKRGGKLKDKEKEQK